MQSNEMLLNSKPNCLILDEIDGIESKAAVDVIIRMATTPLKGKQSSLALRRPMICICNDPFVSALREVKKHCHVFHLPPPSSTRLLQRLKSICVAESLPISSNALSELITSCGMDIRSALHTLQFLSIKVNVNEDTNALERMLTQGIKDTKRDVFKLWRSILSKSDLQAHRKSDTTVQSKAVSNLSWLIHEVNEFNDYSQILSGVHEHLLFGSYHEIYMSNTSAALDWISCGDMLQGTMKTGVLQRYLHNWITFLGTSSEYGLLDYLPHMMGAVHLLCSSSQRVKVNWPKKVGTLVYVEWSDPILRITNGSLLLIAMALFYKVYMNQVIKNLL